MGTSTYPPYLQTICFVFQNFNFFIFYDFFVNMGPYGRKKSNDISSESKHHIHSQKIMRTSRKGLYQSCSKHCEISNFGFFCQFFFVFVNMGPYRGKSFKRHLLNNTPDLCPKIHVYSWGGSLTKLLKIVKFEILDFWQFLAV